MFERIRIINGRQYRYREERYREGRKVRSRSTYLGTVDEQYDEAMDKAWRAADRFIARHEKQQAKEKAAKEEAAKVGEEQKSGGLGKGNDVSDTE